MEIYQQEYESFISKYKSGVQIGGEEVGKIIAILAQYFGDKNLMLAEKENTFRKKAAETINGVDPSTLKPISAAKAEILTDATLEAEEYRLAKAHLENINQYLNALKSLQKGIISESGMLGGT